MWSQWSTNLDQRAAAPLSWLQLAAGRSWSAAALVVTFNVCHGARLGQGAHFGEPGYNMGALWAGGPVRFTGVTAGAAVVSIITTDRLRNIKGDSKLSETQFVSVWGCLNNHQPLAEDSSPICGSCPWSSRSYPWGSWFGRRTCSWLAELRWKQPDWAPSAGPVSSAARVGWADRACHKSVQPRYICSLWGSSAHDRYSTRPGKNKIEKLFNASWSPCKCQIFSSTDARDFMQRDFQTNDIKVKECHVVLKHSRSSLSKNNICFSVIQKSHSNISDLLFNAFKTEQVMKLQSGRSRWHFHTLNSLPKVFF